MGDFLFDEFSEVSAKQWKQKIQVDLKGADYNDTLVWESNEGIKVKPFYHVDDYEALDGGEGQRETAICQSIYISNEQTANFLAKDALSRGATSLQFEASEAFDIDQLFESLLITEKVGIHFKLHFFSESFVLDLRKYASERHFYLNIDPVGQLVKDGNWFSNKGADFDAVQRILSTTSKSTTVLGVDAGHYQNAGANIVQQIAYALGHANEYLNLITKEDREWSTAKKIQFNVALGSNYFFEIAKLRALRYLWQLIVTEYELEIEAHIFVVPSLRNKTLYDYNTNMLRTTSECMSAILGGADTVSNIAYDAIYHKKNEFGERIARNQLLILQDESYFKEASKCSEGSYYVESLTKQLAEKALELFKDIERSGGFLKQLLEGTIQRKIAESASKEQHQFDSGQEVLLGTNKYPNPKDAMKDTLELFPFVKIKPRKTMIQPIIARRLAEKLEQERLENE